MLPADVVVISKGDNPDRPGYSAFDGRTPKGKTLLVDLRDHQIDSLYVSGIATEYCVKATVLDALRAGLRVTVLPDAVAGIDVHPGDADRALEEMSKAGAVIAQDIAA
jgi:nicotinamidase/pyrazinamidase